MEIKFNPRSQFPGRGPCIELVGDWVTEAVWETVAGILHANHMDSPAYKARTKATAFFQGGHNDPKGEWILIECWAKEEECADFLAYLNKEINEVIDKDREVIAVVAKTMDQADIQKIEDAVALIVDDTGCAMGDEDETAIRKCRSLFKPVDNVQYAKVYFHLLYTFQIKPLVFCKPSEVQPSRILERTVGGVVYQTRHMTQCDLSVIHSDDPTVANNDGWRRSKTPGTMIRVKPTVDQSELVKIDDMLASRDVVKEMVRTGVIPTRDESKE